MACFSMAINSIALAGSFVYVPLNANVVLQFCTVWLNDRNIGWYLAVEQKKKLVVCVEHSSLLEKGLF